MTKEVNLDIGGGKKAEYFTGLAIANPAAYFIVLDPKRFKCPSVGIYPNLQLFRWGANPYWELPFRNQIIDHAHLNFIYGVFDNPNADEKIIYQQLITSLLRVLKRDGTVHVREQKYLIGYLRDFFEEQGFSVSDIRELADKSVTSASRLSTELAKEGNPFLKGSDEELTQENSGYLPMEFEASLR